MIQLHCLSGKPNKSMTSKLHHCLCCIWDMSSSKMSPSSSLFTSQTLLATSPVHAKRIIKKKMFETSHRSCRFIFIPMVEISLGTPAAAIFSFTASSSNASTHWAKAPFSGRCPTSAKAHFGGWRSESDDEIHGENASKMTIFYTNIRFFLGLFDECDMHSVPTVSNPIKVPLETWRNIKNPGCWEFVPPGNLKDLPKTWNWSETTSDWVMSKNIQKIM